MKQRATKHRQVLNDIMLIAALLAVGTAMLLLVKTGKDGAKEVRVEVDGVETGRYSLEKDGIYTLNGGTNIMVIEGGAAYLKDADCPDKLCVKQGKISRQGQCIVCLPNKLIITAAGGSMADGGSMTRGRNKLHSGNVARGGNAAADAVEIVI